MLGGEGTCLHLPCRGGTEGRRDGHTKKQAQSWVSCESGRGRYSSSSSSECLDVVMRAGGSGVGVGGFMHILAHPQEETKIPSEPLPGARC